MNWIIQLKPCFQNKMSGSFITEFISNHTVDSDSVDNELTADSNFEWYITIEKQLVFGSDFYEVST